MYSRVFSRFVRKTSSGNGIRLRIQDVTPDLVENAMDLYTKHYLRDEPWSIAAGIPRNPRALAEFRKLFEERMRSPGFSCTICCEDKDDSIVKVLGVFGLELKKRTDPIEDEQAETKEFQKYNEFIRSFTKMSNLAEKLAVPCYYQEVGLVVAPKYRHMGIVKEFVKVCTLLCKLQGVPLVGAIMTSAATQKAVMKENWETLAEVDFEEFGRQNGVTFQSAPATIKYMIKRV